MDILPAIDLRNGQCVRLEKGDFSTAKIYSADPLEQARKFTEAGAKWMHIVDLDGAETGKMKQFELIAQIAQKTAIKIQVGGGIRDAETIRKLLDAGVKRVVIGSLAVKNKILVQGWLRQFGPKQIVLAFDIKYVDEQPEVLTNGWRSESKQLLWDVLDAYEKTRLIRILCTDISRDGMLAGANSALYQAIHKHAPKLGIIASGGVDSLDGLMTLAKGPVEAVVVGKALYEGKVDLAKALQQVKNAG